MNVLPGGWRAKVEFFEDHDWGRRVSRLTAWKTDLQPILETDWQHVPHCVDVDSGQAGFFDLEHYPEGETGKCGDLNTFYGRACATSHTKEEGFTAGRIDDFGVVASSGFGDGGYNLEAVFKGKITDPYLFEHTDAIALRVTFIGDDEEE
jgi:hypothetical protein